MQSLSRDHLLKEIVFFIHEKIKKNKKNVQPEKKQDHANFFMQHNNILDKIEANWPLKKGSVEKNYLAWNMYESSNEVVNAFIAFIIKVIATLIKKNNIQFSKEFNSLENIFKNKYLSSFFWEDIKQYYQSYSMSSKTNKENRTSVVKSLLPHNSHVALCIDSSFFRLRSGINQELTSFENLIEDLYKTNNTLVVFSRQKLFNQNKDNLKVNNYSISFKINKDLIKTSIYQALEPQTHLIQSNRFIEPNKTGCFDRLIAILSAGQDFVQNVEAEFKLWQQ